MHTFLSSVLVFHSNCISCARFILYHVTGFVNWFVSAIHNRVFQGYCVVSPTLEVQIVAFKRVGTRILGSHTIKMTPTLNNCLEIL